MSSSTVPTPQDARLVLQETVTKTANFNSIAHNMGAGYDPGAVGQRLSALVAVVTRDVADGNESYAYTLQESADNATFAACGATTSVSTWAAWTFQNRTSLPTSQSGVE